MEQLLAIDGPAEVPARDELVVSHAADLFLREGMANVKMVDIADAAGVGVATLYRHFSTKAHIAVRAATLLWRRFCEQMEQLVTSDGFLAQNGIGRLRMLLEAHCDAYMANAGFVSFLGEFDHLVLTERIDADELAEYGRQVGSLCAFFEDAYNLGRSDGSIRRQLDFKAYYLALAHALTGVAQKLSQGEVLPTDDFSQGDKELRCLVDMAIWSLQSEG